MPKDKRKVEESLLKKGFVGTEGDHHFFVYHTLEGKKSSIRTKTSHTPKMKEINDGLLAQMAKQCGVLIPTDLISHQQLKFKLISNSTIKMNQVTTNAHFPYLLADRPCPCIENLNYLVRKKTH